MKLTIEVEELSNGTYKANADYTSTNGGRWTFAEVADSAEESYSKALYRLVCSDAGLKVHQIKILFEFLKSLNVNES